MPLGLEGYEPEPIEEPYPEREKGRFTVQGVGCTLLALAAFITIALFVQQTYFGEKPYRTDLYSPSERASLDEWLAKHDQETPWLNAVRANIVGERVFFYLTSEDRVYRLRNLSMRDCEAKMLSPLSMSGFKPTSTKASGVDTEQAQYSAEFENDKDGTTVKISHAGSPLLHNPTAPSDSRDLFLVISMNHDPLPPNIKDELGFDPSRTIGELDWNKLGPPK